MKKSNKYQIYQIVVSGLLLSLSFVLGMISKFVPFFRMPSGGGISLSMIPLTFIGLILGPIYGLVSGFLYGTFNMLVDGAFSWGFLSILLDYFLSYSSAFICGFFRKYFYKKKIWSIITSLALFIVLRFICHFLSGVILYNPYIEETGIVFSSPAIAYSTVYNLGYLIPTFVISLLICLIIAEPIFKLFNNNIFIILGKDYLDKKESNKIETIMYYLLGLSLICLIFSNILNISLKDISINFSFLSIISLVLSSLILFYNLYLINIKDEITYFDNQVRYKIFRSNYKLYFCLIILSIPVISFSILSICFNYIK